MTGEVLLLAVNEAFADPKTEKLWLKLTEAVQAVFVAEGAMGDHIRLAAMALLAAEIETMAADGNPAAKVFPGGADAYLGAYREVYDLALAVSRDSQDVVRAQPSTELPT